jgi:L-seryl-tRNA(Ser) seleniumtransferase
MNPLRALPSVNRVLECAADRCESQAIPRAMLVAAVRAELTEWRRRWRVQPPSAAALADVTRQVAAQAVERALAHRQQSFRRVINATGVVLHTNLGRAVLADSAVEAVHRAASGYLNLEIDLQTGKRANRTRGLRGLIAAVTGAESGLAVNNCAAATILVLRALARDREVIISRGQLIEIGGSFRIPEIMAVSGAILREVGTTNITRLGDYERAIGPNTALLMRVHTSNYRVRGFTKAVGLPELVKLARQHRLLVVDDLGSGALVDLGEVGLTGEPVAAASIATGADVILFSADKLMGGPQAGIIAGRAALIAQLEADPLMRALRLDKLTLAALEATLWLYTDPAAARASVPTLRMLALTPLQLRPRCQRLAEALASLPGVQAVVGEDVGYVGGGTFADVPLASVVVRLRVDGLSAARLARRLRQGEPAVLTRVVDDAVQLDLRAVLPAEEAELIARCRHALGLSAP